MAGLPPQPRPPRSGPLRTIHSSTLAVFLMAIFVLHRCALLIPPSSRIQELPAALWSETPHHSTMERFPTPADKLNEEKLRRAATELFLSRFDHAPWPVTGTIPGRAARRNRVFISSLPAVLGDGLGHRFTMVNFEMKLATLFGLGYAHRRSLYGSITPAGDRLAVERLFGWLEGFELRADILARSCARVTLVGDACHFNATTNVVCTRLRPRSAGGEFDRLVRIPARIVDCFVRPRAHWRCVRAARAFFAKHNAPHTLFQMTPRACHVNYCSGEYSLTRAALRSAYWRFHARYGVAAGPPAPKARDPSHVVLPRAARSRVLALDARRAQVAVHVRRGDFRLYRKRQSIPDAVYADVVAEVVRALDEEVGRTVPVDVHVYSEGVLRGKRAKDNHDQSAMRPVYADERGHETKPGHWDRLVAARLPPGRARAPALHVHLHIASDTVGALHDMIAADVFVASQSGMSVQIAANYARGVVLLPLAVGRPLDSGTHGRSLLYAYTEGNHTAQVRRDRLHERVAEDVRRFRLDLAGA